MQCQQQKQVDKSEFDVPGSGIFANKGEPQEIPEARQVAQHAMHARK